MMSGPPTVQFLDWDSSFFGVRIARLVNKYPLTVETIREVNAYCIRQNIACLYYLCPLDDYARVHIVEKDGFQCVDVRLTFEYTELGNLDETVSEDIMIRTAVQEDLPSLEAIARTVHNNTRFSNDGNFATQRVQALYERWIQRSVVESVDTTFVASRQNILVGYVACHVDQLTRLGQISLIGVDGEYRGQGTGMALLRHALGWFKSEHVDKVIVVTQGGNIAAQRLYQRMGFVTQKAELWFHKWYGPSTT